jgi:hypothetical protein
MLPWLSTAMLSRITVAVAQSPEGVASTVVNLPAVASTFLIAHDKRSAIYRSSAALTAIAIGASDCRLQQSDQRLRSLL